MNGPVPGASNGWVPGDADATAVTTPSGIDTPCGRDLAVRLAGAEVDPRRLSQAVFASCGEVHFGSAGARERARVWEGWDAARRSNALKCVADLVDATWRGGCSAEGVLAATHRHLGELTGEISLDRCVRKTLDPSFTKPMLAFWTCPVVPGDGPVGFEQLIRELKPGRAYAAWDVTAAPCRLLVVDSPDDWAGLVATTGPDPEREHPTPRWNEVPFDAVHVTNRAIIASFAPGATPLWDWGLEQTAWLRPRGSYARRSATEAWADAVARLAPS